MILPTYSSKQRIPEIGDFVISSVTYKHGDEIEAGRIVERTEEYVSYCTGFNRAGIVLLDFFKRGERASITLDKFFPIDESVVRSQSTLVHVPYEHSLFLELLFREDSHYRKSVEKLFKK